MQPPPPGLHVSLATAPPPAQETLSTLLDTKVNTDDERRGCEAAEAGADAVPLGERHSLDSESETAPRHLKIHIKSGKNIKV